MAEPFKFSFSGDDIEDDGYDDQLEQKTGEHANGNADATNPKAELHPARYHTLDELIQLLPQHISYSPHRVRGAGGNVRIYRRELFDVKMQLMTEEQQQQQTSTSTSNEADEETKILLDSSEDIKRGVYEGGLKSWECAEDLVGVLHDNDNDDEEGEIGGIMELGCGTALPSGYVLGRILRRRLKNREKEEGFKRIRMTMADYNLSVLRLVTLPNLLLAYIQSQSDDTSTTSTDEEEAETTLDITPSLLSSFEDTLSKLNIQLDFVSGSWNGGAFSSLLSGERYGVILAAETLYQPENLGLFTDVLGVCLAGDGRVLIGTKKVYFGVGGGVKEFEALLEKRDGGEVNGKKLAWRVVRDSGSEGVGRCVGEVKWV